MEGLRAYAVVLTFCVHFFGAWLVNVRGIDPSNVAPQQVPSNTDFVLAWLQMSPHGVYLFFILSGFLICRIVGNARTFSYPRFLWRRFWRIYPAFIMALALGLLVYCSHPAGPSFSWTEIGANLLLLNGIPQLGVRPILNQTWSLFYEVVFYLTFPALLLLRPVGVWRTAWGLSLVGVAVVYLPFAFGWGSAVFLMFFAGATVARFDDNSLTAFAQRMPQWLVVTLYCGVTSAIAFRLVDEHTSIWLYSFAGAVLMIEVCYGRGWLNRLFSWRPIRRIGNVSYSLFLVHTIPIYLLINFGPDWISSRGLVRAFFGAILALLSSIVLAGALFLIAERPYFAAKRKKQP